MVTDVATDRTSQILDLMKQGDDAFNSRDTKGSTPSVIPTSSRT